MEPKRPKLDPEIVMDERYPETPGVNHPPGVPRDYLPRPIPTSNPLGPSGVGFASNMSTSCYSSTAFTSGNLSSSSYPASSSPYLPIPPYSVSTSSYCASSSSTYPRCLSSHPASSNSQYPASSSSYFHASSNKPYPASSSSYLDASYNKPYPASSSSYLDASYNKPDLASSSSYLHDSSNKPYPTSDAPYVDSSNRHYAANYNSPYSKPTLVYPDRHYPAPPSRKQRSSSFPHPSMGSRGYTSKFGPSKYVQKDCQEAEIAALKQKLVDMEARLMRVTAELEQVKNERAYDKINFETGKCELESKIGKYKEQYSELQSENETLRRYLQDLKSSNIQSKMNLSNTNLNSRTTKVNEINEDACNMNALPNEIIQKIFSYLTQNQLGQIARVCVKWSMLTKNPALWKKVNVKIFCSSDRKEDAQFFNAFIDGLPSCVTFIRLIFLGGANFYKYLDFEELCMKLHHSSPHVEVLILERCETSTGLSENINFCTQFLTGLKKLVLHDCRFELQDNLKTEIFGLYDTNFSHSSMTQIHYSGTKELQDNSNIEVLDLYLSNLFYSSKIQISKLLSLKELRLPGTYIHDWFVGDVSFWNQLHVLDLGWTRVSDSTIRAIGRHGQNLKELYLCSLDVFDGHLNFNQMFPHLKIICLRRTHVTCEGVVSLLRSCPSLVSVYVDIYVVQRFAEHPFVVANRCKSGIVKNIDRDHNHNVDYLHN